MSGERKPADNEHALWDAYALACHDADARALGSHCFSAAVAVRLLAKRLEEHGSDRPHVVTAARSRVPDVLDLAGKLEQLGADLLREVARG